MNEEILYTIAVGNFVDGIALYGNFECAEDAVRRAEEVFRNEEWNIVPISNC